MRSRCNVIIGPLARDFFLRRGARRRGTLVERIYGMRIGAHRAREVHCGVDRMALLQALIALVGRSAGKLLNAIFGWAVRALFGGVSGTQQTLLTILVACAAMWPLLLIGVAAPRAAAFLITFVPIPKAIPEEAIRAVWIALAVVLPGILGLALAAKSTIQTASEAFIVRVARGYPITIGIAVAFWMSFVSVPILRLVSAARRHTDADVTLIASARAYDQLAAEVQRVLNACGFALAVREPRFWVWAPMSVMRALGGPTLRHFVPSRLVHLQGPKLEIALYPASLLLRGPVKDTVLAHGLIVEALTPLDAFQTTATEAQAIEREIRDLWRTLHERAGTSRVALHSRLRAIANELLRLEASYDDWQTVYRETLQLGRAINGDPQLLAEAAAESPDLSCAGRAGATHAAPNV